MWGDYIDRFVLISLAI